MKALFQYYLKSVGIIFCVFIIFYSLSTQVSQLIRAQSHGAWGIYHYYIGGKYLKELGYFDLYSCSLEANKDSWKSIKKARDLKTYKIVPINKLSRCPVNNFSKERWNEFSKDVSFITSRAPLQYWENALTDKGFNATPFWAALSAVVSDIISLNSATYLFLFNLDILFIVVTSLVVWRSAGKFVGLTTLILSFLYFGALNIIGGNFLQYGWLPLLAGSFVLWNKKSFGKSGVMLGLATGLQAFPVFFALPVLFNFIFSAINKRNKEAKPYFIFLKTFIVTLLFCFLIGGIYGGVYSWTQWSEKITIQKNYINGEIFNIGFPNLIGSVLTNHNSNSETYSEDYIHTVRRVKAIEKNAILLYLTTFFLLIPVFGTIYRSKKINPMIFGYFFIYITTTLSPYYYLTLALLPFVFWNNSRYVKRFALWGTLGLFLIHLLLFPRGYVVFDYQRHLLSEVLIFYFFFILLILLSLETKKLRI